MSERRRYKTEPLKTTREVKQLRQKYYEDYWKAKERGGIRVSGSAAMLFAVPAGLGEDVFILSGEPYGAKAGSSIDFSTQCMEAVERYGLSRELCAYMRNYLGSLLLDKYILPDGTILDGWPGADFYWTPHYCCTHAGWYRIAGEMGDNAPLFALDMTIAFNKEKMLGYLVQQVLEGIEWMEKVTGREYNDELFWEAAKNECKSNSLWGEICSYQKNIPAPLDELELIYFYVLNVLMPHKKEAVQLYLNFRDEVKDRVERGIAAHPVEKYRVMMSEPQPPWPYIYTIWRYMERKYNAVPIGSLHTFFLGGSLVEDKDGNVVPQPDLEEKIKAKGIRINNREDMVRAYIDFKLFWPEVYILRADKLQRRFDFDKRIFQQWRTDFVFVHLNGGCEATCLNQPELKSFLVEQGIPTLAFEGSMADHRDIDLNRLLRNIDTFFEAVVR